MEELAIQKLTLGRVVRYSPNKKDDFWRQETYAATVSATDGNLAGDLSVYSNDRTRPVMLIRNVLHKSLCAEGEPHWDWPPRNEIPNTNVKSSL